MSTGLDPGVLYLYGVIKEAVSQKNLAEKSYNLQTATDPTSLPPPPTDNLLTFPIFLTLYASLAAACF